MGLVREHNLGRSGDDLYALLLAAHDGLDAEASARLNARLVLILMNHIGEPGVLGEAIGLARATAGPPAAGTPTRSD